MQFKFTNALFLQEMSIPKIIVKSIFFLCCTSVFSFSSYVLFSQNAKVTIDRDKTVTIFEVLDLIGAQTECTFIYQANIFKNLPAVNIKKGVVRVSNLLNQCLPQKDFKIVVTKDNYITISLQQQTIQVKGVVKDSLSSPLGGVNVFIKETNRGSISDTDGSYTVIAKTTDTLVFSMVGYKTQNIAVSGRSEINVILLEDITELGSVTINAGYYTVKQRESTGSIVSVKESEIEQQPISNPVAALQGRVPGVEIVQTSGIAGAGFDIKIRGQNSIRTRANNPLFVIDGVPYSTETLGEQQTSSIIPGYGYSPLNDIDPNNIESISILKDADATSIYGSRGANGVVLITTKKGDLGKTRFRFGATSSLGQVSHFMDLLNTTEYLEMRREAFENDGGGELPFNAYDINGTWDENRYTDWQKELFGKTSFINNMHGSLSGGDYSNRFLLSGNFYSQESVFPGSHINEKISVLANYNHHSKNDKLDLNISTTYTSNNNDLPGDALFVFTALRLPPNAPRLYDDNGNLNWENSTWSNPLSRLDGIYRANTSTLIANTNINYNIFKNIDIKTNFGFTENNIKEIKTVPITIYDPAYGLGPEYSYAVHNRGTRKSYIIEPQLQWNFDVKNTGIELLAGLSFQDSKENRFSQSAVGFSNDKFIENISAASNLAPIADTDLHYRYNAVFGRINLNHLGRYIINFTARRDGSSRFGTNKRFANFAALGAAWIFSDEEFMKNLQSLISFGKLRASYGTSGNDQIGDYQYLDTYSFGSSQYQNTTGLFPTRLFNPDFSWEVNKKLELTLELGLLKDRINITTNHYRNRSSNQLVGIPLPATTGFNSINANLNATVENTGWEFGLNTQNIKYRDFEWTSTFNISLPKNRLLAFPDLDGSTYASQLVIGEPLNIRKIYNSTGVDPSTGLYSFEDYNGDGRISGPEDRQLIKSLDPKFYGGFGNMIKYKDLRFDLLLTFSKKEGFNYWYTPGSIPGAMSNQPGVVLNRWQSPGDITDIQSFTTGTNQDAYSSFYNHASSSAAISDASYIRLKTLSLSYQLAKYPTDGFGCEVFVRGQNLLTISNYLGLDPETESIFTIPPLRIISLGTTITL